jgi:hypothetical protein
LKYFILTIIEEIPKEQFIILKRRLIDERLILTPSEGSQLMKVRRFITKITKANRDNEKLELLIQKSLIIVDLGFPYIPDTLLSVFAT